MSPLLSRWRPCRVSWMPVACWLTLFSSTLLADEPILTLEQAISMALADNPSLAQIKARSEAMAAIPLQEGSLPDPTLNFGALNLPTANGLNLQKEDMTMLEVGISQPIPFPGKLALREKAATFEAEAAAHNVEEARLQLARDVNIHWWQLMFVHRSLLIISDTEQQLKQLARIADTQYRVGKGLRQDVLSALLAQTRLTKEKAQHLAMHRAELARLNALLNRPADKAVHLPDSVDVHLPAIGSAPDLQAQSEKSRPRLAERKNAIDAAQSRLELAEKDYYPDFTVGTAYAFRQNTPEGQSRSDFASVQLSMTLPIYTGRKQAKAVNQRQSELLKERYALDEAHREIQTEINAALALYQGSLEQFELLKNDMLPLAQQNVAASLSAYQVGKADFQSVIQAQNAWFDYQTQYWQALAEAHQALAQLAAAVGRDAL
ncbi:MULTISPECIES: TolC family protein [unclassified Methylobacter]|jgi:cobalt-zinc-cadmium efflux system outer membrane protein|uniref:TolC family protein n=1 Tax=unclassified Methylobacter TaxID=2635283 RepID=UPI001895BCD9|nr:MULTISPECIES: TolC family protein [unclassified Methylobacter]MBF6650976.1 TolC family protein [Methylobacter sp. BlB1]WAK04511.1 TolC family protein [Methylobacter sp. YRD-M1]WAK04568.1 TolC family protein [Methylobacter sp. YRD-M1]